MNIDLNKDLSKILITKEEIETRISEMAKEINRKYRDKDVLMIGILKGSFVFMADLMRKIDLNVKIDFMAVSSYGSSSRSTGEVRIILDLKQPVENYHLIIVEDILDSGATLSYLKTLLLARNPLSIGIVTLLDKPERRKADIKADITGFVIPDEFVVGYGLDYAEKYRNLPDIAILSPEVYTVSN